MKRRRKKKGITIKLIISRCIILICLIGITYSSYHIIKWKINIDNNAKIKKKIDNNIIIIKNRTTQEEEYEIDFTSLKKQNNDVIAYLKVNGTNIDYIVLRGEDNEFYLNHNFDRKYNDAGWVYSDYHNKFDGTDNNIVIFGHNMHDGSMFGTLYKTLDKNWYQNSENHKIVLVTEHNTYHYEVFSTYSIEPEDYYIKTSFKDDEEFAKFVKELKSRSIYNYEKEVTSDDKILTLSSCIGDGKNRVVLHAKLIKEE